MTTAHDDVDRLMQEYRDRRGEAAALQGRLREVRASATAPRRVVTAHVGAHGELTGLEFPTGAYKRLPPRELADVVVSTVEAARRDAAGQLTALLAPSMPPGLDARGLLDGSVTATDLLPENPVPAPEVRAYLDATPAPERAR